MNVKNKLEAVKEQIAKACALSDRDPNDITIVAVTKYAGIEKAEEALDAGINHLGENRDDGFLSKWDVLKDRPTWHFIGTLQSRKVKNIIDKVDFIHSLDRLSLAKEINKRADEPKNCFVQVNVSGEESKHGLDPEKVLEFVDSLKPYGNIKVVGLMTMAPFTDDEDLLRSCFRKLREIQEEIKEKQWEHAPCTELSMGMSNDYQIAIEEGATYVRIGSAIVGE